MGTLFTRNGYGQAAFNYKTVRAHRLAYEAFVGPIPKGMCVCHRCDVRECVNPDHLFLGTSQENMADRDQKGRTARGEKQGFARLTSAQALAVYSDPRKGVTIATEYGVTPGTVSSIKHGRNWAHVTGHLHAA